MSRTANWLAFNPLKLKQIVLQNITLGNRNVRTHLSSIAHPIQLLRFLSPLLAGVGVMLVLSLNALAEDAIKVLMLGDSGFHNPSGLYRTINEPLKKSGIELTYTENLSDINPDNLKGFAGLLIFANIEKISPEAEKALLEYVDNGGGLIPVHCASFCFLNSDKYVNLVGGQFKRHGFTRFETKIVAADHEIMKGLKPISSEDESYMHSRHNQDRIVLETRSDASGPVSDPNGEPYTWIREVGKGRVFYTAWGHDIRTWGNVDFQNLLSRGIRWACHAQLTAVTAPSGSGEDTSNAPAESKAVAQANRPFTVPEMMKPTIDPKLFEFDRSGSENPELHARTTVGHTRRSVDRDAEGSASRNLDQGLFGSSKF